MTGFGDCCDGNPLMVGDLVILVKDLDDDNDEVAIRVEMPAFGRIGYVATSVQNCAEGTESAELICEPICATFLGSRAPWLLMPLLRSVPRRYSMTM